MAFSAANSRVRFGKSAAQAKPGTAVAPGLITDAGESNFAKLAEADAVLDVVPEPGQVLHAIMTGRYDLTDLVKALAGKLGVISDLRIATLSYNKRNLGQLMELLDTGKVRQMMMVCSVFFRDHNRSVWDESLAEFHKRSCRIAAARSHAKVITLSCFSGQKLSIEGSANLRSNSNIEQVTIFHDATVHDWHAAWIGDMVTTHEGDKSGSDGQG